MSLIEKAAEKLKAKESSLLERAAGKLPGIEANAPSEPSAPVEPARAEPAPAPSSPAPSTPPPAASEAQGAASSHYVEIDLESLDARGFITPGTEPTITAEEFRIIKRSMLLKAFSKVEGGPERANLILVSSCQPSEGKTFSAINLALSMATEQDMTVLLVDADFAKPDVLKTLGIKEGKGLVDVISDPTVTIGDCLIKTNIPNLTLLPAGRRHHLTTELLASDRMGEIVDELAQRYPDRVIIFDSPPVLASTETSVLALHVGQCLFVVEAERTEREQIEEGLSLLSNCKNISMMLNKSKFVGGTAKFGSYYGYGYGYGKRTLQK